MKEKIINSSQKLFLTFGFKTVTMDDIANELSISKKTIYNFFNNKTELVTATAHNLHEQLVKGISAIRNKSDDPIKEFFEVKDLILEHLHDQRNHSIYQLEKFYPEIYKSVKNKHLDFMIKSFGEVLMSGIKFGLFRKNINVDFVSRIYFNSISGLMNPEIYPPENYTLEKSLEKYREYFLRSIVTEKGLKKLDEILINDK
jgi:hypothetical protein